MNDLGSLIRTAGRLTVHEDYTENVCRVGEHAALAGARRALKEWLRRWTVAMTGEPGDPQQLAVAMLAELGDE